MKTVIFLFILINSCTNLTSFKIKYPSIEKKEKTENFHGLTVRDPYSNIEQLNDTLIQTWFKNQGILTDSILSRIKSKDTLLEKMLFLDRRSEEKLQLYRLNGNGSYFYIKPNKETNSNSFYYREHKDGKEILILDPEKYKSDWIIQYFKVSWDFSKIAFSLSPKGEKKSDLIIYDFETETFLPEVLTGLNASFLGGIEWLPDSSGFLYLNIPHFDYSDPTYLLETKTKLHFLGADQKEDKIIFSGQTQPNLPFKKGDFPIVKLINPDNPLLIGKISSVAEFNNTYYKPFQIENIEDTEWKLLFSDKEKIDQFFIAGNNLIYQTAKNSANFKICKTSLDSLNFQSPEVVVKENENEVISDFEVFDEKIIYSTITNGVNANLYLIDNGQTKKIKLPEPVGSIRISKRGEFLLISTTGWLSPRITYNYDINTGKFTDMGLEEISFPEFKDFVVEEVEVESHDGVMIPLSLIYKNGIEKKGKNNTLLISYGAYGASYSPKFSIQRQAWVLEGGIVAIAHVRGGGEKGNDWHASGFKTTKSNTWKDVISCSEYLIDHNYTSPEYLVNRGVSAGGIAVGRSITERPDLYAVAIMESPSLNLVRSEFQPNGPANVDEFGTVNDSLEFNALLEMDSYHHLKEDGSYPSVMINVGMKDGQVTPWDPGKFIARLQNMTDTKNPVLMSVQFESGHVGDGSRRGFFRNVSMLYSFALWQLGHPDYQLE
ncbi:prolyl oligopeptidase family serine peptidase [Maribacter sp. 2307UL18-2]|uniref:prolyl oligopeptidase family serine peptidase n=1 Tax=Maribacter sp. 2307UL18-2 TaxID=3386274 RepID=UPI0039BD7D15